VISKSRRDLLGRIALAGSGFLLVPRAWGQERKPEISSFDLSLLDDWLTPNDLFFVRDHFPAPAVFAEKWKISVSGAVASTVEIPFDELARLRRKSLAVTLECAENPVGGGMVGHAEWGGVGLAEILERARPQADALFVRLRGADGFSRTIPLQKALHPDMLLALTMNGERLPPAHGFPVRAVIAGWYGMDSVKWLQSIEVLRQEEHSAAPGAYRRLRSGLGGGRDAGPIAAMEVKSVFSRPLDGAILQGRRFTVRGATWAGEKKVRAVEVSTDGGRSWAAARFSAGQPAPQPYAWAHWEYDWKIPGQGFYKIACRAADESGRVQPAERAADRADEYERNAVEVVKVSVV
jgi:DMSO/TMAO reductase YedYZ molybdopterin-dependent catalytic subunit